MNAEPIPWEMPIGKNANERHLIYEWSSFHCGTVSGKKLENNFVSRLFHTVNVGIHMHMSTYTHTQDVASEEKCERITTGPNNKYKGTTEMEALIKHSLL